MPKTMRMNAVVALMATAFSGMSIGPAGAITAERAKKCRELTVKAVPTQLPGTKSTAARDQRAYFTACLDNKGEMPKTDAKAADAKPTDSKGGPTPANARPGETASQPGAARLQPR